MASISAAFQIAIQHHGAGRLDLAEQIYQRILAADPNHPDALHLLGVACHQRGRHEEAIRHIERAAALNASRADFHSNLAAAYLAAQRIDEAVAAYQRAVQLEPNNADLHFNLGRALQKHGRFGDAVAFYERALSLKPNHAPAHNNLGVALKDQGKLDEAIACYQRALQHRPDYRDAIANLANALKDQGDLAGALECDRRVVELAPDYAAGHSNLLYTLQFSPDYDSRQVFEEHQRWYQRHAAPLAKSTRPHGNDRSLHRRLRVGYVSPDFRFHAESFFTVPLLSAHDHQQFEIFCYADVARPDQITAKLQSCADTWRDIGGITEEQLADLVRQDQIDILVDLTMHMGNNHLLAFARKPAPVQVCWLAYQGTTGLPAIDYRITDSLVDPPGLFDKYYCEESIRLSGSFWCYDPLENATTVGPLPALKNGYVTFASLNNFCKVNAPLLKLWAQVLKSVDRSRLVMLAAEGRHRERTLHILAQEGVDPERVTFVAKIPRADYLALHGGIDIGLDTVPYNGQTTTFDALWMGVPVVTLLGHTAVGRAGLSILSNLGLPELVGQDAGQFVQVAAGLANDLPRLHALRDTLRGRLQESPLMDARRFARSMEQAYRTIWHRWCAVNS
jgi:predicted O-linked N-acetylglucosamine transferase (SPINDLY family)